MSQGDIEKEGVVESTLGQRIAVLLASIMGSSMAFVNGTAVTLALDPIQAGLNASLGEMLWVASIYMLFISALMLIGGAIGDFYGRRATFIAGVILFTIASIGCAAAPTAEVLIFARAIQGMGAALLTPMSLTLLSDYFPRKSRGMAIGIWSVASAIMTAIGPPVGGWLVEFASWRMIFILPLPFGILSMLIAWWFVPKRPPARIPDRIDWAGALLAIIGFAGIAYGFITLSEPHSAHKSLEWGVPIGIGLVALLLLVIVEREVKSPMMPPELFGISTFNAINVITFLLYGAMGGIFVFYPIFLTDAFGFRMNEIGVAFLGFALPMVIFTPLSAKLARRYGVRMMLATGSLVGVAAFASMGLAPWSGTLAGVFGSITIFGAGIALVVPGMNTALFNATPEHSHGVASGINNAAARAATLFAIAGYGAVAGWAFYKVAEKNPVVSAVGYGAGDDLVGLNAANYREAMIYSFEMLAWVSIALCFLAFIVAMFFIDPSIEKSHPHGHEGEEEAQSTGIRRIFGASLGDRTDVDEDDD
ncbi:MFS transporter [Parvularcula marina]|uniref:MFS transporter n=1 Tax=Parvularcula marina TaxID=2292771 RepID=A0A371RI32_9PROT|nr:MFS transporter [Parvularcula marina]RFB05126.1 MFS transporter [Parvularcula marina]